MHKKTENLKQPKNRQKESSGQHHACRILSADYGQQGINELPTVQVMGVEGAKLGE